jgi:hypothetical protein
MEIIIGVLIFIICLSITALLYGFVRYQRLLAKYEIVSDELCGYLDADIKDSGSEWGNVR